MIFDSNVRINGDFASYRARAKKNGVDGFCITAFSEFDKKAFANKDDLVITRGADIEYVPETCDRTAMELAGLPYDMIINSVKTVSSGSLLDYATYERPRDAVYGEFLQKVLDSFDTPVDFSVLGNIALPCKYSNYPLANIEFCEFPELLDAVLMRAVYSQKGLEVDISMLAHGEIFPSASVLKHYRELGGELITLTSVPSECEFLGKNHARAHEMLKELGFKYFALYRNLCAEMLPL